MTHWIKTVAAAIALALATSGGHAQELKVATTAPEQSPWGAWLAAAAAKTEELSGGALKLNIYYGGQLGDEQVTMGLVSRGRVDIAAVTTNGASLLEPGLETIHLPFLWKSDAEFDCAVDNHILPMIRDMLADKGVVAISNFEVPPYVLFSKDPVRSPADLKGQSWRAIPTRVSVGFLTAAGAHAVPLGNADMVTSLQTGAVVGASTSGLFGIALGIHQMAPNILLTQHSRVVGNLYVSTDTWKNLSEENQKILVEATSDIDSIRRGARGTEQAMLDKAAQGGTIVTKLTEEQQTEWRLLAEPAYDDLIKEAGGRAGEIWSVIGKAKETCKG